MLELLTASSDATPFYTLKELEKKGGKAGVVEQTIKDVMVRRARCRLHRCSLLLMLILSVLGIALLYLRLHRPAVRAAVAGRPRQRGKSTH